jgi:hypothetical protein
VLTVPLPLNAAESWHDAASLFEPSFSNSTPLTRGVNRASAPHSLDRPFKRVGG